MFTIVFFALLGIVAAVAIALFLKQTALGALAGIALFVSGVAFSSFTVISAGHTGVIVTLSQLKRSMQWRKHKLV